MTPHIRLISTPKGETRFVLDVRHTGGKREKRHFETRAEVDAALADLEAQESMGGQVWMNLGARGRAEVLLTVRECAELGVTVRELLEFWKKSRKNFVNGEPVTVGRLVHETIAVAKAKNLRPSYVEMLTYELNRFADGREKQPIHAITLSVIEQWLAAQKGRDGKKAAAPSTLLGIKNRLRCLFTEAVRKEYILPDENPMTRVITPVVDSTEVVFLRPNEAKNLLHVCRVLDLPFLPYLVLGMFAGIRPEELERLDWRAIDMEKRRITIDERVSKVRQHRIIDMEPELVEWLTHWLVCFAHAPFEQASCRYIVPVPGDRKDRSVMRHVSGWVRRHRRRLYERAGVKAAADILRKTAATYLMVRHDNENKVALLLGNSPKILNRNYRARLVTREENDEFWKNTPVNVKTDPIALPKGGSGKVAGKLI